MTETAGAAARTLGPDECERYGSVGRLSEAFEAKIVDPSTGEALPPGRKGELWLRGPMIMKGIFSFWRWSSNYYDSTAKKISLTSKKRGFDLTMGGTSNEGIELSGDYSFEQFILNRL